MKFKGRIDRLEGPRGDDVQHDRREDRALVNSDPECAALCEKMDDQGYQLELSGVVSLRDSEAEYQAKRGRTQSGQPCPRNLKRALPCCRPA